MRHLGNLVEVITHNEPELTNNHANENECSDDLDGEDLSVELHQADSGSPFKGLPCVEHAHTSTTASNGRLDSSTKSLIEGNDGVVFLG